MKPFDPHNLNHIDAYKQLCKTGVWPPEHDIIERLESPAWIMLIQGKMAAAWAESFEV
jgi:hypothetical protein